jgi:hypothetical protein
LPVRHPDIELSFYETLSRRLTFFDSSFRGVCTLIGLGTQDEIRRGMKTKHLISALLASVVSATSLVAQPPTPLVGGTEQIAGTVNMYLLNPRGEVDGLLLTDGTQVKFPPHMSADLTRLVKPNERVTTQGVREAASVFTAFTITNSSGQSLNEARPIRPPPPSDLQSVNLTPMQAEGKIRIVLHAPRGEMEGAVLEDGTIVRIAPHVSAQLSALFQPGAAISVRGYGTRNEFGRALEAVEIGSNGQALTAVYGTAAPLPR